VAGSADPFVEHSYYIRSQAMIDDISAVLADTPLDEIPNRAFVERQRSWRIVAETGIRPGRPPEPVPPEPL
jgi:hypothetical protein